MAAAADDLFALLNETRATGFHPVADVLAAAEGGFVSFTPYPDNGVGGPHDRYAWYYHAHDPCPERPWLEHGHFHVFAYVDDLAATIPPWAAPAQPRADNRHAAHLVALCVGADGMPNRLFTLNRWASDETLYPADILAPLIAGYRILDDPRFFATSQWLSAMMRLLEAPIEALLHGRDSVLRAAQAEDAAGFCEDPRLEITSMATFDLDDYLAALAAALDHGGA